MIEPTKKNFTIKMVRPKKHLGQHFLTDSNIARKVVDSLHYPAANVLEVGPGTGILTSLLLNKPIHNFSVIEIDKESATYLRENFPTISDRLFEMDFLTFDIDHIFDGQVSIIGNFPYNISSQILFRILKFRNTVTEVVGMFQKEVADRIAAPPGSKTYGILSVLMQAFYNIEYLFTINPKVFYPPPKVNSAVIRVIRNERKTLDCDESLFFDVVKTAFNQRRKMLRNALGKFEFQKHLKLDEMLQMRAEQLSVSEFEFITNCIIKK